MKKKCAHMYVYGVVRQRATSTATTAGRLFVFCFAVFCLLTSTFCSREHFFKALQQCNSALPHPHSNISTEGLHFSVCRHSYTTLDICVDIGYNTGRHLLLSNILSLPSFALYMDVHLDMYMYIHGCTCTPVTKS